MRFSSEFANFLSLTAPNGFSGRGGQALSPRGPLTVDPAGSSTGSATAIALDYADLTVGTETAGSVISPAQSARVVGLKASHSGCPVGGIVPIDDRIDSVGFFGRSLRDVQLGHDAACTPAGQADRPAKVMVMGEPGSGLQERARAAGVELVAPSTSGTCTCACAGRTEAVLLGGAGPRWNGTWRIPRGRHAPWTTSSPTSEHGHRALRVRRARAGAEGGCWGPRRR